MRIVVGGLVVSSAISAPPSTMDWIVPTHPALVVSSLLFLAPLAVLLDHLHVPHIAAVAGLAVATCALSVATWHRRGSEALARADRVMARSSGAVFTAIGLMVIPAADLLTTGFPLWFAMLGCYALSIALDTHAFHFLFHVCVAAGMCLICSHLVAAGGDGPAIPADVLDLVS